MQRLTCEEPLKFVFEEAVSPPSAEDLHPNEALVQINCVGVCGTDYHAFNGRQPFFTYPRVLGHELSGTVREIGSAVSGISVGNHVSIVPYVHCAESDCKVCSNGRTNCCPKLQVMGVHRDGGMQSLLRVRSDLLVVAPDVVPFDQLAMVECMSIGAHAVRRGEVSPNTTVLISGCGPIGLGVLQLSRIAGASHVVAVDVSAGRLQFCCGYTGMKSEDFVQYNPESEEWEDFVKRIHSIIQPDVVFECTGNPQAMNNVFDFAVNGSRVVMVGLAKTNVAFNDPDFHRRELTILSSRNATREDFQHVVSVIADGRLDLLPLLTHSCSLRELPEELLKWQDPSYGVIKGIVHMQ